MSIQLAKQTLSSWLTALNNVGSDGIGLTNVRLQQLDLLPDEVETVLRGSVANRNLLICNSDAQLTQLVLDRTQMFLLGPELGSKLIHGVREG